MSVSILVVEDEPIIRELLLEFLTRLGYQVLLADSGKEALEYLGNKQIQLALVDLKLPDMEGIEVIKQLKKINPKLTCIVMTAYPTPASQQMAKELGVAAYLTKPFQLSNLQSLLEKALK